MRAWKLVVDYSATCQVWGTRHPCQPTARLPHRAARHRLGAGGLPSQSRGMESPRGISLSSGILTGQARTPCPPRADKTCRAPSAAKPHWITDDGPHAASTTTHHPKLPPVGINAPSSCQNIPPSPTTCPAMLYILGNGKSRSRRSSDRPKRRLLPQKFSVISPSIRPSIHHPSGLLSCPSLTP